MHSTTLHRHGCGQLPQMKHMHPLLGPCCNRVNARVVFRKACPVATHALAPRRSQPLIRTYEQSQQEQAVCRSANPASIHSTPQAGKWDPNPTARPDTEHCVVNFYHLVDVPDPAKVVEEHRAYIAQHNLDVRGRIYFSGQGVNAQFGGVTEDALRYVDWFKSLPLWQGLRYTVWPSEGHAYPKLRLKVKPNLISLAGGCERLPVTKPEARATPLAPADWKSMIANAQEKRVVVLDVRNDYEWDAGHFVGAERPDEEEFAETPVGEAGEDVPTYLRGLPADTPVMMYCTGGIRCDIYSTFLKSKGFNNLYTLEGGIQGYFREEGGAHWKGSLYVFDGRMAISAGNASDARGAADTLAGAAAAGHPLPAAVPCQVCGVGEAQLPHVNCANIDCNELFIACAECKAKFGGCCCADCMTAPRLLRPAKTDGGYYGAWGNYADGETLGPMMATGRSREGRLARRARRREQMRAKRAKQHEERVAQRAMLKEAVAKLEAASANEGGSEVHASSAEGTKAALLARLRRERELRTAAGLGSSQQAQQTAAL